MLWVLLLAALPTRDVVIETAGGGFDTVNAVAATSATEPLDDPPHESREREVDRI